VQEKEDLLITCKSGIILRTSVSHIKESGRATQGVILIRLDEGDEIAAISKMDEAEKTEEEKTEEENGGQTNDNGETKPSDNS
jgi:DNA gyrase subunit A